MALYPKIHVICKCRDKGDATIKKGLSIIITLKKKTDPNNYRAITLSSVVLKLHVYEKCCCPYLKTITNVKLTRYKVDFNQIWDV